MLKKTTVLILVFFATIGISQKNQQWAGYFSYNQVTDITQSPDAVIAATAMALFVKNLTSDNLTTINSVDGLKSQTITAVYHSANFNKTLVGNENGLLLVINQDGSILYKSGIILELPISPLLKKINHFYEFGGKIYISCDYGITVFDLATLEFGDTYYIGANGATTKVYQTTVLNGDIYAVTALYGIKKAALSNSSLVDFNQWQTFDSGTWLGITTFQNKLFALGSNQLVYQYNGSGFVSFLSLTQNGVDIRSGDNYLTITTPDRVYVYDANLVQVRTVASGLINGVTVTFNAALVMNNQVFIATNENGLLATSLTTTSSSTYILPDGPKNNAIFRLKKTNSQLWATYGGYSVTFLTNFLAMGVSKFSSQLGWTYIPYSQIGAGALTDIVPNPKNENEVFISSFANGLVKITNNTAVLYDQNTAPPNGPENQQVVTPTFVLVGINGPAFDSKGNLWFTNVLVANGLKAYKANNTWQSITNWSNQVSAVTSERYSKIVIDKNDTKWVPTSNGNGVVAFNENYANKYIKIKSGTEGNLPTTDVRALAIDNNNQLWIGTARGLRIVQNIESFKSETDIQTKSIIILENDLAQELFYEQFIIDIAVDGANRKWVAIADSGVYLVSSNGQQTLYHFTKDNSPLPSDNINDIEIDSVTGEVFFATDKGLVSFKGTATSANDDLSNVYVYPNPVRPEFQGTVKVSGLTDKAIVKITDIEGNLVYETTAEGGTIEWDTYAFGKYKVASGVYMILISGEEGIETKVKKVMIIR